MGSHDRSKEVIQNVITVSVTSEVIKRNIKIDDGCVPVVTPLLAGHGDVCGLSCVSCCHLSRGDSVRAHMPLALLILTWSRPT